jgi:hypothetical protein
MEKLSMVICILARRRASIFSEKSEFERLSAELSKWLAILLPKIPRFGG